MRQKAISKMPLACIAPLETIEIYLSIYLSIYGGVVAEYSRKIYNVVGEQPRARERNASAAIVARH